MLRTFIPLYQKIPSQFANVSKIRFLFRVFAIFLAGLHMLVAIRSQSMNADGISYLDIGDAYFRGDWENAINPVWSPLYSLILGLANQVFKPSMEWEFPVVHMVNFLIFVGTLICFEFMWAKVRLNNPNNPQEGSHHISGRLWWTLGYLLFIWTSLSLIQIWSVTPDLLMAAFVCLAAGLISQIRRGEDSWRYFLGLGLVLGLGYLSKTFMFIISPVFLGLAWLVQKRDRLSLISPLLAVGAFLLVSLPFILLISERKAKLTFGEVGLVTYIRHVNRIPYPHWQGDPFNNSFPTHPSRVIHQYPPVYEFGEPIGGTYPISTDPSYWYEGITIDINSKDLWNLLIINGSYYLDLFLRQQGGLLACAIALYLMGRKTAWRPLEILKKWALVIPPLIAFALYGMVLMEGRYIGVFILIFWADILANIQLPDTVNNRSWVKVLGIIASLGLLANVVLFNLDGFGRLDPNIGISFVTPTASPAKPLEVGQALRALGVREDDRVGVIGYAYDSYWARLARVKIVAELLDYQAMDFWLGDEVLQQNVLQAFAGTGARAIIAEYVPEYIQLQGWHQVGHSNFYIYVFSEQSAYP